MYGVKLNEGINFRLRSGCSSIFSYALNSAFLFVSSFSFSPFSKPHNALLYVRFHHSFWRCPLSKFTQLFFCLKTQEHAINVSFKRLKWRRITLNLQF